MNILIVGCGKVGSGLANALYKKGHDVAIIDAHKENFSRLDNGFTGYAVAGIPIDLDVLQKGGIEACDFVAAVTDDDNTNVMVSQLAKTIFNVPKVLTRIYDPKRKDVFAQFGLHTISPTALTVDLIEKIITGRDTTVSPTFVYGDSTLAVDSLPVPRSYWGTPLTKVEHDTNETIIGVVQKSGKVTLRDVNENYALQAGDKIIFAKII